MSDKFILRGVKPIEVVSKMYEPFGIANSPPPKATIKICRSYNLRMTDMPDPQNMRMITDRKGDTHKILVNRISDDAPCYWCRIPRRMFKCDPILRPIDIIYKENGMLILGDGNYCSFECCYTDIKEKSRGNNPDYPNISESECLLNQIYHICGGEGKINEANDWRLHELNGGTMTEEQYRSENYKMTITSNIEVSRVHLQYKINLNV